MQVPTASPWNGLGARESAPPREHLDAEEPPVQRTVPAAAAVSPFLANPFRPSAGSAPEPANDTAADTTTPEDSPMPRTKKKAARKARPTKGSSVQFRVCALLLSNGNMSGEDLFAKIGGDKSAFHSGIYLGKQAGRIEKLADGNFRLTAAGKEWVNGGANLAHQQRSGDTPRKVRTGRRTRKAKELDRGERRRAGVVAVRDGKPVKDAEPPARAEATFRCAVLSDGSFLLAKEDVSIELDAEEHAQMLRYLERMAETA